MSAVPARLRWACRRGMLELDLLLMAYLEQVYPTLSSAHQRVFADLLAEPDGSLYHWLLSGGTPASAFQELVQDIRILAMRGDGCHSEAVR